MPVENHRKKLMASGHQWGDAPPLYKGPPQLAARRSESTIEATADHIVRGKKTDSSTTALRDDYSHCASHLDALLPDSMNHILSAPKPSKAHVTTKDWSLEALLSTSPNFRPIPRISALSDALATKLNEYDGSGLPLVIEKWHDHSKWSHVKFSVEHFVANTKPAEISVRNVHDWTDKQMSLPDFIQRSRATPVFTTEEENERLYGKDAPCPPEWTKWLREANVLPSALLPDGPNDYFRCRPQEVLVETLMCYLGIGDTFTPCHKDLCASSGQNLMTYTENGGSSFWFMTESSSAPMAADYFQKLKQELDHENHVITVEELAKAPFNVYITEQKLGDLVLVPPRSCHQVVNNGGITIKTSWSRMTLKGLSTALYHELPVYRRVCRPETYQIKSTIYYALLRQTEELKSVIAHSKRDTLSQSRFSQSLSGSASRSPTPPTAIAYPVSNSRREPPPLLRSEENLLKSLIVNVKELLGLFSDILLEEYSPDNANMQCVSSNGENIVCDFCGADVFQSFFECRKCVEGGDGSDGGYIICSGCYAEGRSCRCEVMDAMQCREFAVLLHDRRRVIEVLKASMNLANKGLRPQFNHFISESDLLSRKYYGAFRAACVLRQTRLQQKKDTKVCTHPRTGDPSHEATFSWCLTCRKCHSAKCFGHLLADSRVHSIAALLVHADDKTHSHFHHRHQEGKRNFEAGIHSLHLSQKNGSKPDPQLLLVHNALKYGGCRPINPTFMKLGWYDISAQIVDVPVESENTSAELPMLDFMSPLTTIPPSPVSSSGELEPDVPADLETFEAPTNLETLEAPTSPESLKASFPSISTIGPIAPSLHNREIMKFVLIPSPSYSISRTAKPRSSDSTPAESSNMRSEQVQEDSHTIMDTDIITPPSKKRRVSDASAPEIAVVTRAKRASKEKSAKHKRKEQVRMLPAKDTPSSIDESIPENEVPNFVPGSSGARESSSQQVVVSGTKTSNVSHDKAAQLPKRIRPSESPRASTSTGNHRLLPRKTTLSKNITRSNMATVSLMHALNNAGAQNTRTISDSEEEGSTPKQRQLFKRRRVSVEETGEDDREESPAILDDDSAQDSQMTSHVTERTGDATRQKATASHRRKVASGASGAATSPNENNAERSSGGKRKAATVSNSTEPNDDISQQIVNPAARRLPRKANPTGPVSVNFIDLSVRKRRAEMLLEDENAKLKQRIAQLEQEKEEKDRLTHEDQFSTQVAGKVVQIMAAQVSSMWQSQQPSILHSNHWPQYSLPPNQYAYNQGQYNPGPSTSSQHEYEVPYNVREGNYHPQRPRAHPKGNKYRSRSVNSQGHGQPEGLVHFSSPVRRGFPKFPKRSRALPKHLELQRLTWDRPANSDEQGEGDGAMISRNPMPPYHSYDDQCRTRGDLIDLQDDQVRTQWRNSRRRENANASSSSGTSQNTDMNDTSMTNEECDSHLPGPAPQDGPCKLPPDAVQIPSEAVAMERSNSGQSSSQDWEDEYEIPDEVVEVLRKTSQDTRTSQQLPNTVVKNNILSEDLTVNPWT